MKFSKQYRSGLIPRFLMALSLSCSLLAGPVLAQEGNMDAYASYSEQGTRLFNSGQLSQAIEMFEKAMAAAPETSQSVIYNNLAVAYMKRGNYFMGRPGEMENALNDFRKAYFYLEYAWAEGLERKPLHEKNRQVAKDNLEIAYRNQKLNPADKAMHLEMAKKLRMQGKFPEAIVEYGMAFELNKGDLPTAKALGDLFTVINLPEKAKKYYANALNTTPTASAGQTALAQDELLVQLGNSQYKTGEIDKAVANFDKALAINPKNTGALSQLEKIWLNEIKFNPTSVLGHANLGSVYQKQRRYEEAYQQYNAAEHFSDQDPNTPFDVKKLMRLNMGTLFQERKQLEQAQRAYDTVLQVDPNHALANYYRATLLEESGNVNGAIQGYNKVLALEPGNKNAQEHLFSLIKKQSDPAAVGRGLKDYADRFSNNAVVQAQIGEEFHNRKELDNAAMYYQRAIQLDPKLASAWANLGSVYEAQGKQEESLEAFNRAKILDPDNSTFQKLAQDAQSALGYNAYQEAVRLEQAHKPEEALPYFKKALETTDTAEIRAAYGISLQSAGQLDNAIAQYQQALTKEPGNADYQYYMGTAYHQKKDMGKAQMAYQKALSLKPNYPEAKQALEAILQDQAAGDLEKAVDTYNKQNYPQALTLVNAALAKNKEEPMAHYYKGLILDAQKKPQLAVQSYRDAIRLKSDFTDAYYALGVALDNTKDTPGAKSAFEQFVNLSGDNNDDFVKYAKERLSSMVNP